MIQSLRRRRRPPNRLLWSFFLAFAAICAVYLAISSAWPSRSNQFGYVLAAGIFDLAIAFWAFGVGASIGSFLNVVAWRLPRGKSINGRSHCPYCDNAIPARDNLPVIGWILLRGRCRFCHLPIASRYPIVEAIVGLSLMLLGLTVLYRGRAFLPYAIPSWGNNWPWRIAILDTAEYVALAYLYSLGAILWAMALIRFDKHRVPRSLPMLGTWIICITLLAIPALQPLPWQVFVPETTVDQELMLKLNPKRQYWEATDRADVGMYLLLGACSATMASFLLGLATRGLNHADPDGPTEPGLAWDVFAGWWVAGLMLGWQTFLGAVPLFLLIAVLINRWLPRADWGACILFATAWTVPWLVLFWPWIAR